MKQLIQKQTNKNEYSHILTKNKKVRTIKKSKQRINKKLVITNLFTAYSKNSVSYNTLLFFSLQQSNSFNTSLFLNESGI